MNEINQNESSKIKDAKASKQNRLSLVWVVPLVVALVSIWLGIMTIANQGYDIVVVFENANALVAGKTKVKYKNVDVGTVKKISVNPVTRLVDVFIEMDQSAKTYLRDQTRFWVVKARIASKGVSGLDTIISGAYIGIEPIESGAETRNFVGLENPPGVSKESKGKHYVLTAKNLGSIEEGAPIYFRKFDVGQVEHVELSKSGDRVIIKIFVFAPYDQWVSEQTKFWNSSGINFSLDPNGLKVDTESLASVIVGGISFDSPSVNTSNPIAKNLSEFTLYQSKNEITQEDYEEGVKYFLKFPNSLRGLSVGAPVEFRGLQIGKVEEIQISYDYDTNTVETPIIISLNLKKLHIKSSTNQTLQTFKTDKERVNFFIKNGAKAQLKTGNILTGILFIDIEFFPKSNIVNVNNSAEMSEFPTVPTAIDKITNTLTGTLTKADEMMTQVNQLAYKLNHTVVSDVSSTMLQAKNTLTAMEKLMQEESPMQKNMQNAIIEISKAARSIKSMADFLERHPDSIIKGKQER